MSATSVGSTTIHADQQHDVIPNATAQAIVTISICRRARQSTSVGVAYGSGPDRVEQFCWKSGATTRHRELAGRSSAVARLIPAGDSMLNFTVSYFVAEFADQFRSTWCASGSRRFQKEGIEIPFPTRTVCN
jgi:small-conductance mechanosensitive channel